LSGEAAIRETTQLDGNRTMKTRGSYVVLAVALFGCTPSDPRLPGYRIGSGDVTTIVMQSAISCGGYPIKTNALPKVDGQWRYKTDRDGVQIYLVGDQLSQVQALLLAAFGTPTIPASTNREGRVSGATYASSAIGAVITYGRDDASDGSPYTHIVIVRPGAFKQ
jgi:hypothetical protein